MTILLVEDDPYQARSIEKSLRRSNITNTIVTIGDGQEALDYVLGEGEDVEMEPVSSLPVLLELDLPGLGGYHVFERMKADERTRRIHVIGLTTVDDTRV